MILFFATCLCIKIVSISFFAKSFAESTITQHSMTVCFFLVKITDYSDQHILSYSQKLFIEICTVGIQTKNVHYFLKNLQVLRFCLGLIIIGVYLLNLYIFIKIYLHVYSYDFNTHVRYT